jgi:hypothetical protein
MGVFFAIDPLRSGSHRLVGHDRRHLRRNGTRSDDCLRRAYRFGTSKTPHVVEWLSDNGSAYIAKDMLDTATDLGLRLDPFITSFG